MEKERERKLDEEKNKIIMGKGRAKKEDGGKIRILVVSETVA